VGDPHRDLLADRLTRRRLGGGCGGRPTGRRGARRPSGRRSSGILSLDDIHGTTLGDAILRASQDPEVQRYLAHVDHWDADHLGTGVAFENFRTLAVALDERSRAARAARAASTAAGS
jgi:hypothetical protein